MNHHYYIIIWIVHFNYKIIYRFLLFKIYILLYIMSYTKLKEELFKKDLSQGTIDLYLRNLKKLNNDEEFKTLNFLNKPDIILEKIKNLKDNTKRQYLISIVTTLKTMGKDKLYDKYYKLMIDINDKIKEQPKNEMSETQKNNWMEWDDILKKYNEYESTINFNKKKLTEKEYIKILNYVILSCYIRIQPRRNKDWIEMVINNVDKSDKDYNYYDYQNKKFIFNNYKNVKDELKNNNNEVKIIDVPDELNDILMNYITKIHPILKYKRRLNKAENIHLLVNYDGDQLTNTNIITRILNKIFKKNISSSMLRHIYLSSKYGDVLKEQEKDAEAMSHNIQTQKDYIKIK